METINQKKIDIDGETVELSRLVELYIESKNLIQSKALIELSQRTR